MIRKRRYLGNIPWFRSGHKTGSSSVISVPPRGAKVRSGLSVGSNGIVQGLGAGAQFTLSDLSTALSAVNPQSLSAALDLPDISETTPEEVDLYNILSKLIMGQASDDVVMKYATATVFLKVLVDLVQQLKQTVDALNTLLYTINETKNIKSEGRPIDVTAIVSYAFWPYFSHVDLGDPDNLLLAQLKVYSAANGIKNAVFDVRDALRDRKTVEQALNEMGYNNHIDLLKTVIVQVSEYAKEVQRTANVTRMAK